jgi:hypothetical protein
MVVILKFANKSLFSFAFLPGFEDNNYGNSEFTLVTDGSGYHGLVEEGATVVNVTPPIRVDKTNSHELLCNIFILQNGRRFDKSPFEV